MLRRLVPLLCLAPALLFAQPRVTTRSRGGAGGVAGNPVYQALTLTREGTRLSGVFDGDPLEGQRVGESLRFTSTDSRKSTYVLTGKVTGDTMRGEADFPDPNDAKARVKHGFTARRIPERPAGPPRRHEFKPT